tara:strand:+ start:345 stop:542 length:198 start_codon:yes stop_codon:yes gene_type:complete
MMKNELFSHPSPKAYSTLSFERNDILEEMKKPSCPLSLKEKSKLVTYLKSTSRKMNVELLPIKDL